MANSFVQCDEMKKVQKKVLTNGGKGLKMALKAIEKRPNNQKVRYKEMTNKQLKQAIKKVADWDAQKKEMEALKKVIYAELLDRADKKVEYEDGYTATYVEGYIQMRDDIEAVKAFYLLHHDCIPKIEKSISATVKVYKAKDKESKE